MYRVWSWYLAKAIVGIPLQCLQTLFFGLIAYFMVGYTITVSNVFIYLAAYALFQITSESIGVMCAAVTKNSTYATLALTFVLLILLSFSGFLVSDVPVYFRWLEKCHISPTHLRQLESVSLTRQILSARLEISARLGKLFQGVNCFPAPLIMDSVLV
eukprot:jgi/Picre1/35354/NNA_002816.t1